MSKQKKEPLSFMTIKTLLGILLFTGMGTIIIGGVYIIGEHYKNKASNQIMKPVDQETENYYDLLEKKCDDSCCLSSSKRMRANNYKKADKNGKCPEGFYMDMLKCVTSYQWCEPMEEIEWENCEQDSDCEARFSHCDCQYHCVNKNIEADDCAVECDKTGPIISECICENNKCVEEKDDTSNWQTYRNEEFGFGVVFDKEYKDIWKSKTTSYTNEDILARTDFYFKDYQTHIFSNIRIYDSEWFHKNSLIEEEYAEEMQENIKIAWKNKDKGLSNYLGTYLGENDNYVFTLGISPNGCNATESLCSLSLLSGKMIINSFFVIKNDQPDTSDWQTYRNEEFGFEFKYQEDLKSEEEKERINLKLLNCGTTITVFDRKFIYLYEFNDEVIKFAENPEQYKNYYYDNSDNSDEGNQMRIMTKKIKIDGNTALDIHILSKLELGRNIFIFRDNYAFVIHGIIPYAFVSEEEKETDLRYQMFNKFLSTFKFID